jgi:hypothetical protein
MDFEDIPTKDLFSLPVQIDKMAKACIKAIKLNFTRQ